MKSAIAWFAGNPVASNLIMFVLIVSGLATIPTLTQELIPDVELEMITVQTPYPGASPSEVEASITNRIEEQLQGLQGVKQIHSTSAESMSAVTIDLLAGEDVRRRLDDVRAAIDTIDTMPDDAEEPQIQQVEIPKQVMMVAVYGEADDWTLKRLAQQVRDQIVELPGITEADIRLDREFEISIEVSEAAMQRYGITFDDVVMAVQRSSLDLPGGSIKTDSGEILLRATGQAYETTQFEKIALVSRNDGTRLSLGDVANVYDGFAEDDTRARFDGHPAMFVQVNRVGEQKSLEISTTVHDYVAAADTQLPEGIMLSVWGDESRVLRDRLDTMLRNARGGFMLVVLILAMFLRLRLALWVSLGIPISFLGAVALMPIMGMSINYISLMAFIVVLGIVVDDAIVVGENTYTIQGKMGKKLEGAILGAQSIVVPVTFGVLTTVAAFAPLAFLPGPMGRMTRVVPIIVITCLMLSLWESMFILPAHLGHGKKPLDAPSTTRISMAWRRFQMGVAGRLQYLIQDLYMPLLRRAIEWRYLTIAIAVSLLMFSIGLPAGGWLKFVFQEPVEADFMIADLTMVQGTPAYITSGIVDQMERAAMEIRDEVDGSKPEGAPGVFPHIMSALAEHPMGSRQGFGWSGRGGSSNLGEVQVEIVNAKYRDQSVKDLVGLWRDRVGDIPGAVELKFTSSLMNMGDAIEIELSGHDLHRLKLGADAVRRLLGSYPGVYDIADSFRGGKKEFEYSIKPSAEALGLTLQDLARQLRQGFYGAEAQTIQRGRDEVKVMVRYPASERRSLSDVEEMRIRTADGSEIPFSRVANATMGTGFSSISHIDRRRVVSVTAEVDNAVTNANEIVASLKKGPLAEALAPYDSVLYAFEGQQADQSEFLRVQLIGMLASLLVIYALLAVPLGSYLQPLIIMSAIPFGFVGAAWGHMLLGYSLTMYSVIGFVALAGIVVNSSLVLVDHVNKRLEAGKPIEEAVIDAGCARFRPILLTSLTTFAGLTPMMLETSVQAKFMIPMAISIAFGVLFSSFITLFMVPCSYILLDDWLGFTRRGEPARPTTASDAHDYAAQTT